MSDDDQKSIYSSSSDDESDYEEETNQTHIKKNGPTIDEYEEDEENQDGGGDSDLEEGEIKEGLSDDDDNDFDPEENDDDDSIDETDFNEEPEHPAKHVAAESTQKAKPKKHIPLQIDSDDEDELDDGEQENYLQKFDSELTKNYIKENHPECFTHNYEEISLLTKVVRNSENIIVDPLHKTIPFLTKYEKARVLGQRAKQIESGAKPFVRVPENIVDGYLIAELELKQKRIPFIIRRPLPHGGSEYWNLKDLENITF